MSINLSNSMHIEDLKVSLLCKYNKISYNYMNLEFRDNKNYIIFNSGAFVACCHVVAKRHDIRHILGL